MIDVASCDFNEFAAWMKTQYSSAAFEKGYKLIKDNFNLIHDEDGEDRLAAKLQPYFSDMDQVKGFINFVTTYLIVQNMNFGI